MSDQQGFFQRKKIRRKRAISTSGRIISQLPSVFSGSETKMFYLDLGYLQSTLEATDATAEMASCTDIQATCPIFYTLFLWGFGDGWSRGNSIPGPISSFFCVTNEFDFLRLTVNSHRSLQTVQIRSLCRHRRSPLESPSASAPYCMW